MATRREFLKGLVAGMFLASLNPATVLAAPQKTEPILVALHLTGGNDALNTLVPSGNAVYRAARPNLALPAKNLLTLERGYALHPALRQVRSLYDEGAVKLFAGIGREDHDRSHFRSSDIWNAAGHPGGDGWMAGVSRRVGCVPVSLGPSVSRAVACPDHPPVGLVGDHPMNLDWEPDLQKTWFGMYRDFADGSRPAVRLKESAKVMEDVIDRLHAGMQKSRPRTAFAGDEFGKRFELAYRLIAAGFPTRVMHLSAGKFDTHSGQLGNHHQQLAQFDGAVSAFLQNMEALEVPVTLMVYSEFGRRVAENFSGGTDHGAGGLAWLMGHGVKGGLEGEYRLETLRDGDIATVVPYKKLYCQAVEASLGTGALKASALST